MERFAQRKVKILMGRSGQKLTWFCPDQGEKIFIGEYSQYMDNKSICADVKEKLQKECKLKMASAYGQSVRRVDERLSTEND